MTESILEASMTTPEPFCKLSSRPFPSCTPGLLSSESSSFGSLLLPHVGDKDRIADSLGAWASIDGLASCAR